MTRKDYIVIAEGIRTAQADPTSRRNVAAQVALKLKADNDRFDMLQFMEACENLG